MEKKLKKIATELLDLSKRNRLINYKDNGLKAINILNRDIEEVFSNVVNGKVYKLPIFDDVLKKYHNDLILNKEEDDFLNYSDLKVFDICGKILKQNELLVYKRGYTIEKTLKSIFKEYQFYLTERGINPLYITFGMLKYVEKGEEFLAPLLLIPVNMTSDKGIYKITEADNEIILNPTLSYYFKTNYKINLRPFDEEKDTLIEYVLEIKKHLLKDMDITNLMTLGQYSFLKMNMYNDLTENSKNVLSNDNVRTLLGDDYIPNILGNDQIYPVVNADSSQLEAIKMASRGESFVLEGPPGSGKSQTITNIIATLIGNGKHVLFVSEKLAALNVVYENLRRVGLNEFAIELHSAKANKKDFVDELYKTAISPKKLLKQEANDIVLKRDLYIEKIKSHYAELHDKIIDNTYSLYDLYEMYLKIDGIDLDYRLNVKDYSLKELDNVTKSLDEYKNYAKIISIDYKKSPFYGIENIENEYLRYDFKNDLIKSIKYLRDLIDLKNKIKNYFNIINVKDIYNSIETINKLVSLKTFEEYYLKKDIRTKLIDNINSYIDLKSKLDNMKSIKNYSEKILDLDIEDILIKYKEVSLSFFKIFNSDYKKLNAKILSYRNEKAKSNVLINELNELKDYKTYYKDLKENEIKIKEYIDSFDKLDIILNDLKSLNNIIPTKIKKDEYKASLNDFKDILISSKSLMKSDLILANISKVFDNQIFDLYNVNLNEALNKLEAISLKLEDVKAYLLMKKSLNDIKALGYINYIDYYVNKYDINNISLNFKKLYLKEFIYSIIDKSVFLSDFNSYDESNLISEFRKLDEEVFEINKDKIISLNSNKRPDDTIISGTKFKILINEHNKERRQKPIRELLNNIFELALDIKPIFLMSPLSVSTYLSSDASIFDTVIFDEASQIYASDALGAIYRAKQAIIIGDSKQMPPSNFFDSQSFDEEDEDDNQSILDLASLSYKMLRLKWHYRSRSEELITFSNKAYYDNSLITIPQAKNHEPGFGIDFIYLKNGRYDATKRTNYEEAKLIKDLVFKHLKESDESLGVVAFSDVQAKLINSLIEDEIKLNPKLADLLTKSADEPFFVKNLETVQGDERDRIIFSICYGYNNENKFYQRFGPLNNVGGEKRLNVAITRAKFNITVVSSIRYLDIRTDNTDSIGVKNLKGYLEFIENITIEKEIKNETDGIIKNVSSYLESLGYSVYPNYGSSSFKIDLAIMKDDKFIMALMLDKESKRSVTDNDRLIPLLLKRLGWSYYKLYLTSWVNNNELEKKNLLNALENVDSKVEKKVFSELDNSDYLIIDNSHHDIESMFLEYIELDNNLGLNIYNKDGMDKLIKTIVEIESPIHEEYLYKRVANILNLKVTNVLKNRINNSIDINLTKKGKFYYNDKDVKFRINEKRDIDYISSDELMAGIFEIVKKSNGISKEGCYKELMKLIGYNRITQQANHLLENAVIFLIADGKIIERNGCLYL